MTGIAALLSVLALGLIAPAQAIPPGGAGPDTPGTSAAVSPRQVSAGSLVRFSVGGFPAGEVVSIKIDDGNFCSQRGVHGACVVHQQRIGANGSVSGSFVLPADLKPGKHWLRFLASAEMRDAAGNYLGVKGYTRRGGADFTVIAAPGTSTAPGTTTNPTGTTPTAGETGSAAPGGPVATPSAVPAGQPMKVSLGSTGPAAEPTSAPAVPTATAAATPEAPTPDPTPVAGAVDPAERRVPWWGLGGLGVALLAALAIAWTPRRTRG